MINDCFYFCIRDKDKINRTDAINVFRLKLILCLKMCRYIKFMDVEDRIRLPLKSQKNDLVILRTTKNDIMEKTLTKVIRSICLFP